MLCDFHPNGDGYKCKRCDRRVSSLGKARCRAFRGLGDTIAKITEFFGFGKGRALDQPKAITDPNFVRNCGPRAPKRVWNYVKAIFCEPCTHRETQRSICLLCGCRVSATASPAMNKIAMATESCPDDPPYWIATVQPNRKPCGGCGKNKDTSHGN
jgi:hypothetical protein